MTTNVPQFIITQPQLQAVFNIITQFPAKDVLPAIDILRGVPQHVPVTKEKTEEPKTE